jgi:hypothetical protein
VSFEEDSGKGDFDKGRYEGLAEYGVCKKETQVLCRVYSQVSQEEALLFCLGQPNSHIWFDVRAGFEL